MGLDWIVEHSSDINYTGPKYHRAKGLSWVLESYGFEESAAMCYGVENKPGQVPHMNSHQINKVLKDCKTMISQQNFSDDILEAIDKDELMEHLHEAKQLLEGVLEKDSDNIFIICDY